jgi:hypothetical protein
VQTGGQPGTLAALNNLVDSLNETNAWGDARENVIGCADRSHTHAAGDIATGTIDAARMPSGLWYGFAEQGNSVMDTNLTVSGDLIVNGVVTLDELLSGNQVRTDCGVTELYNEDDTVTSALQTIERKITTGDIAAATESFLHPFLTGGL